MNASSALPIYTPTRQQLARELETAVALLNDGHVEAEGPYDDLGEMQERAEDLLACETWTALEIGNAETIITYCRANQIR